MSVLLISHNTPDIIETAAHDHGFRVVRMPKADGMPEPVASHPDMLLFAGFGKLFVRAAHMRDPAFADAVGEILGAVPALSLTLTSDEPSRQYPRDVAFNCAVIGGALVGRAESISSSVKRAASEAMLPTLDVAQGYTKCSTMILGSHTRSPIISADKNIHKLAESRGIPAYLIPPGNITLPGYDTGFIGGASFFANGSIYFLGSLDTHPACDKIKEAASAHGIGVVSLTDLPLFDAGCLYIE